MVHKSHELMDTVFDPFVEGEHKHQVFLCKSLSVVFSQKNIVLVIVSRCQSCRVGHETNLIGLG